jgi:hypothetical protein
MIGTSSLLKVRSPELTKQSFILQNKTPLTYSNGVSTCTYYNSQGKPPVTLPSVCSGTYDSTSTVIVGFRIARLFDGAGIARIVAMYYTEFYNVYDPSKFHIVAPMGYGSDNVPEKTDPRRDSVCGSGSNSSLPPYIGATHHDYTSQYTDLVMAPLGYALSQLTIESYVGKVCNMYFKWECVYIPNTTIRPTSRTDSVISRTDGKPGTAYCRDPYIFNDPTTYNVTCTNPTDTYCQSTIISPAITNTTNSSDIFINAINFMHGDDSDNQWDQGVAAIPFVLLLNLKEFLNAYWTRNDDFQDTSCQQFLQGLGNYSQTQIAMYLISAQTDCDTFYNTKCTTSRMLSSTSGCYNWCQKASNNCDARLSTLCSQPDVDLTIDGYLKMCSCFLPATVTQANCKKINENIPKAELNCQQSQCYGSCANPLTLKPFEVKNNQGSVCPSITQCIAYVDVDNKGQIEGNIGINPSQECKSYVTDSDTTINNPPAAGDDNKDDDSTTTPPPDDVDDTTNPPPTEIPDEDNESMFDKYKIFIILGGIGLLLLIIIGIALSV